MSRSTTDGDGHKQAGLGPRAQNGGMGGSSLALPGGGKGPPHLPEKTEDGRLQSGSASGSEGEASPSSKERDPRLTRIFGPDGSLAASLQNTRYEARASQLEMANAVLHTLSNGGTALMEAGTGTGKSLAYLVPAVLSGARVIVSTATLALQEQLMREDIPKLLAMPELGLETDDFAVLKGLGNYLCLRRYDELLRSAESVAKPRLARSLPLLAHFRSATKSGDRNDGTWTHQGDTLSELWPLVSSSSETRIGPRCVYHDECFVTHARDRAEKARVIVVNHHLFFADLALRKEGRAVLPNYGAVIFDEAHHLSETATQFFSIELSSQRIERFVHDVEHGLPRALAAEFENALRTTLLRASDLFRARNVAGEGRAALDRTSNGFAEEYALAMNLEAALDAVESALLALRGDGPWLSVATENAMRARKIRSDIAEIFDGTTQLVRFVEMRQKNLVYCACPREVGAILQASLFSEPKSFVLTSATLTAPIQSQKDKPEIEASAETRIDDLAELPPEEGLAAPKGPFAYFRERIGIDSTGDVDEYVFASPFAFASQCALYLPEMPDPRAADYFSLAIEEILELVQMAQGGAFVLTTSMRMLEDIRAHIGNALAQVGPLLVQNSASKSELLARFKASGNAVLLGTSTFWEGVDVPGHALRLVILDKLPFLVPSDPKVAARAESIRERGGNPFRELFLPHAMIALKQGFGRLVRSTHDRGVVAILDGRLRTKGYGKVLLRGLPDARVVHERDELQSFFEV